MTAPNIADLPPYLAAKRRYRAAEAAEYLALVHGVEITESTLAKKRCLGGGPPFFRTTMRAILYERGDLDAWAAKTLGQPVASTSEADANRARA